MFKLYQESCRLISARNLIKSKRHYANSSQVQKPTSTISPKFLTDFNTFYPKLVDTVLNGINYLENEEIRKRIKTVAEEYPLIKNPLQGEFFIFVYEQLENPKDINEKKIQQAYVLGALQEIVQAYLIIADDILDQSETRNSKTCWYLLPGVSKLGINDFSLLRSFTFEMVKQNIEEEYCSKVIDQTQEMYLQTEMSQHLDFRTKDFKNFTVDVYNRTQCGKSADYAMVSPIKMALILANKASEKSFQLVNDMCDDLGIMIQINNDYTEYRDYRKPFTKKSGFDIKKRVCSWPAVTALQHFNTEQRKIFEENYGKMDDECEKRIVKLYDAVNIDELFLKERESRYKRFLEKVEKLPSDAVPSAHVFRQILKFYRSYADDITKYYYS